MLTAAQARELAGATITDKVAKLLVKVEELAKEQKRALRTGWDYKEDAKLWIDSGYRGTVEWKRAKQILEELGYKVSFYYRDGSICVDMYTLIEW